MFGWSTLDWITGKSEIILTTMLNIIRCTNGGKKNLLDSLTFWIWSCLCKGGICVCMTGFKSRGLNLSVEVVPVRICWPITLHIRSIFVQKFPQFLRGMFLMIKQTVWGPALEAAFSEVETYLIWFDGPTTFSTREKERESNICN